MAGPNGQRSAMKLTDSLVKAGLTLMRFKTGTPARVDRRTIDFSRTEPQYGDEAVRNFSFISPITERQQVPCYLTYTNPGPIRSFGTTLTGAACSTEPSKV